MTSLPIQLSKVALLSTLLLAASACGGDDDSGGRPDSGGPIDASGPVASVAQFAPSTPGAGADWGTLPYPSSLFLNGDGRIALDVLPTGELADESAATQLREALLTMDGFGVGTNVYFPVVGDVDEATLAGNVVLVDLDDNGAEVPLDLLFRPELSAIVAAPKLGITLAENRHYAAYITRDALSPDGTPLAATAEFLAAVDTSDTPADPAIAAAQASLAPLLDVLDAATRDQLVVATVFATENVSRDALALRNIVAANPPAIDQAAGFVRFGPAAEELDQLFGVQDPDAVAGHDHLVGRPQPHGSIATVIHGTIDIASFLSTEFATDGRLEFDGDGLPIVKSMQPARFTLVLPVADSYANIPVLVWVHGINRTRADMLAIAEPAAKRGFAVIAIDLLHHGDRRKGAFDKKNDTTREPGCDSSSPPCSLPDGFADQVEILPAANFFHLLPSGELDAYHPLSMRENLRQSAIDLCSLASFISGSDLTPLQDELLAAGLPSDLSFRGEEIGIVTESFGSMLSIVALAIEPRFDIAMLASPASSFPYPTLIHSPNFSDSFSPIILSPLGADERTVLGDERRGARFEPIVTLWNSVMQTGDPIAFAPHLLDGALRGDDGVNFVIAESFSDEFVPNDAVEHLVGVLGIPVMEISGTTSPPGDILFRYVDFTIVPGPFEGNVNAGKRTAVHTMWHPAAHALVRKIRDESTFEPGFPPFIRRDSPVLYDTPVEKVQALWGEFFTAFYAGDSSPPISDPYAL